MFECETFPSSEFGIPSKFLTKILEFDFVSHSIQKEKSTDLWAAVLWADRLPSWDPVDKMVFADVVFGRVKEHEVVLERNNII